MSKRGAKTKAGILLSRFIKEISTEETEVAEDGEPKMITKAEALARQIWKCALGYTEVATERKGEVLVEHTRKVKPDKGYVDLILDRMEGKVGMIGEANKRPQTIAEKIGEQGKRRINSVIDQTQA
ncbi:MAG TPA: hypothetical protein VMW50_08180 [Dehalococcoidia bacterium]|nr:hypothetical protein [Dehalococcoidia bacterium]